MSVARTGSLRSPSTLLTLALGLLLASCGSRSLNPPSPDAGSAGNSSTGNGTGAAGSTGSAGTGVGTGAAGASGGTGASGASGGTTGAAGASGGASGAAGASGGAGGHAGTGGTPGCDVPCAPIACNVGFTPTADPASCCPVCKPIVCNGACAIPQCGPNSHLEKADGACCATCMPGTVDSACTKGEAEYAAFRMELLQKYNDGGCQTDDDCAILSEENACASSCGDVILGAELMNAIANLDSNASTACATCPKTEVGSCPPVTALCSNSMCVAGTPPTR